MQPFLLLNPKAPIKASIQVARQCQWKFAMIQIWPVFTAAGFLLRNQQATHVSMQMSVKGKFHICMLDSQLRIHSTDSEGGKAPGNARLQIHVGLR